MPPDIGQAVGQALSRFAQEEVMAAESRGRTVPPPAQQGPVEELQFIGHAGNMRPARRK
jgi:hypothetical protein